MGLNFFYCSQFSCVCNIQEIKTKCNKSWTRLIQFSCIGLTEEISLKRYIYIMILYLFLFYLIHAITIRFTSNRFIVIETKNNVYKNWLQLFSTFKFMYFYNDAFPGFPKRELFKIIWQCNKIESSNRDALRRSSSRAL